MYKNICLTLLVAISATNLYMNTIEPRIRQYKIDTLQSVQYAHHFP